MKENRNYSIVNRGGVKNLKLTHCIGFFDKFRILYKKIIVVGVFIFFFCVIAFTYAIKIKEDSNLMLSNILRIDEAAYGATTFDSSNLRLVPILDKNVEVTQGSVMDIEFYVGGNKRNNREHIVYDIALVDLTIDCALLSPYVKWKLVKNGEVLSSGSLDYQFDTIVDGRFILTPIQQDLVDYSKDKSLYDHYHFYLWLSDSCQSDNLLDGLDSKDQSNLLGKKIQGKIEVELYAEDKKELIRKPSEVLDVNTCVDSDGDYS